MRWPPPDRALEGELVRLEPLAERDREPLRSISGEPEIWRWIDRRVSESPGGFDDWFADRLAARAAETEYGFATLKASDDQPLGSSSILAPRPPHELKTDARNERSRGAMAALPAEFEGIFRKHMNMPLAGVRDSAYFSIVDDDWPSVRSNLTSRLARAREAANA